MPKTLIVNFSKLFNCDKCRSFPGQFNCLQSSLHSSSLPRADTCQSLVMIIIPYSFRLWCFAWCYGPLWLGPVALSACWRCVYCYCLHSTSCSVASDDWSARCGSLVAAVLAALAGQWSGPRRAAWRAPVVTPAGREHIHLTHVRVYGFQAVNQCVTVTHESILISVHMMYFGFRTTCRINWQ